jgi:hypothetical protein
VGSADLQPDEARAVKTVLFSEVSACGSGRRQHEIQRSRRALVHSPPDAFRCFMGTDIDVLVIGNCFLREEEQDPTFKLDYKNAFELD